MTFTFSNGTKTYKINFLRMDNSYPDNHQLLERLIKPIAEKIETCTKNERSLFNGLYNQDVIYDYIAKVHSCLPTNWQVIETSDA